ncbi:MAG: hypothetical protein Q8P59_11210, partial [Dehalococcoidia bacterium]|nr:hypothetical protein [Dehalococcoidia bacterium]
LLTVREALPEQSANGVIFAQGKLIRERPQLITAWLTARARGVRYAMEHKDEAVALGMKLLKSEDKAAMERAFDDHMKYKIMYPNMDFTPEQIDTIQTDAIAAGTMKEKLPFDKVANTKFLKEMLAQIGEYKK